MIAGVTDQIPSQQQTRNGIAVGNPARLAILNRDDDCGAWSSPEMKTPTSVGRHPGAKDPRIRKSTGNRFAGQQPKIEVERLTWRESS